MKNTRAWMRAVLFLLLLAAPTRADDQPPPSEPPRDQAPKQSLKAINKALTDPVSEAWSIALQQNFFRISPGLGQEEHWNSQLLFQGAFPVALTPEWDLITRPSIEFFDSQPHPEPEDPAHIERTTAFGDIILLQLFAPRRELSSNWIFGVGPTWIFPSGSSRWTTTGKWQVGPAAAFGYLSDKWILAALFQNWTSFGGSGPFATNSMNLLPLAVYFFPNGWSVGYAGNILANWKASATNVYTVPIGLQVGKVSILGPIPLKLVLAAEWMPVHPAIGQVWNVQLTIQALRPKLLRGYLNDPSTLKLRWEE
ncbi:MAG TPA: hypothetical protein DEP35_00005 [Deltaproteobacteria bacterium]|nr:hypothetical protein [Deltaproteobacteria bacterium]